MKSSQRLFAAIFLTIGLVSSAFAEPFPAPDGDGEMTPEEMRMYILLQARQALEDSDWEDRIRTKLAERLNLEPSEIKITIHDSDEKQGESQTGEDASEDQEPAQEEQTECLDLDVLDEMYLAGDITLEEYAALVSEALKQKLNNECQ